MGVFHKISCFPLHDPFYIWLEVVVLMYGYGHLKIFYIEEIGEVIFAAKFSVLGRGNQFLQYLLLCIKGVIFRL